MGIVRAGNFKTVGQSNAAKVDGSLRFDSSKSQYLSRTPGSAGSRTTWTWSGWFKKTKYGAEKPIFNSEDAGPSNTEGIRFTSSDTLELFIYNGSGYNQLITSSVFRDVGWYHVVAVLDTTNATSSDRMRLYVNGIRQTVFGTATYPSSGAQCSFINTTTNVNYIGRRHNDRSDNYFSNIHFIDGQALGPEYFGYTDPLTNTWRPKKFTPQATPNNGRIWSTNSTLTNAANAFDGSFSSSATIDTTVRTLTTETITVNNKLEIYTNNYNLQTITLNINGQNYVNINDASNEWTTVPFTGTMSGTTTIVRSAGSAALYAVRVDGVTLIDGDTANIGLNGFYLPLDGNTPIGQDQSGRGNNWTPVNFGGSNTLEKATGALPILNTDGGGKVARVGTRPVTEGFPNAVVNDGTVWSASVTEESDGGYYSGYEANKAFDGSLTTLPNTQANNNNGNITFTPATAISYTSSVRAYWAAATTATYSFNGGANQNLTSGQGWVDIASGSGTFTSLNTYRAGDGVFFAAIEIDGEILVDGLGLVLALPLVGNANDVSATIKGSGSNKTVTVTNAVSSVDSNFYGGSYYFDGTGDYLTLSANSDFNFGTGDFTIEAWVKVTIPLGNFRQTLCGQTDNVTGRYGVRLDNNGSGNFGFTYYSSVAADYRNLVSDLKVTSGVWSHIAVVRQSGVFKFFVNGVKASTDVSSYTTELVGNDSSAFYVARNVWDGSSYDAVQYVQDLRVYKGLAKYTQNFIPASTDPDILPDTPSGVAYSSNVALVPSTDGAVAFDGSGDYLELADSDDWDFGTGDFTVECYAYFNDTTSVNSTMINRWGTDAYIWTFQIVSSTQNFRFYTASANLATPSNSIGPNKWYHFAASRSSGTLKLFIDGVEKASSSFTVNLDGTSRLNVGAEVGNAALPTNGFISNARVIKGTALYTSNFTPPTAPITSVENTKLLCCQDQTAFNTGAQPILNTNSTGITTTSGTRSDAYASSIVLALPMNGANNGTTFTDQSATIKGSGSPKTITVYGDSKTTTTESKFYGSSGNFDGNGDFLRTTVTGGFGSGDFTMEFWYYKTSASGQLFNNRTNGDSGDGFDVNHNLNATTSNLVIFSNATVPTNKWIHVAFVRNSGTFKRYIDGVETASTSNSTNFSGSTFSIAGFDLPAGNVGYLTGYMQDFRVYVGSAKYTSNFTVTAPSVEPIAAVSPSSLLGLGNASASNFNPFTVNINAVRGQETGYATLNPLKSATNITLSNGNLNYSFSSTANGHVSSTVGMSTGRWYCEFTVGDRGPIIGLSNVGLGTEQYPGQTSTTYGYYLRGPSKYNNGSSASYGTLADTGDVIGIAFDATDGNLTFYNNGVSQGVAYSGISNDTYFFAGSRGQLTPSGSFNFGQKPFKFPPPAGFQPLALANTPRPSIVRPDQYVGVTTYSGTTANPATITSDDFSFTPDFVWVKSRSNAESHALYDTVRGATYRLRSDTAGAETTGANELQSFIPGGFTAGNNGHIYFNNYTYAAWCWKAGGNSNTFNIDDVGYDTASAAGLTAGTITPTGASVNTKSGFSIIGYTANLAEGGATISHGLGRKPAFAIFKNRDSTLGVDEVDWGVYHQSLGATKKLELNQTLAEGTFDGPFNNTEPTSSLFYFGGRSGGSIQGHSYLTNGPANDRFIGYIWAEIPGFSKFGIYNGNSSNDGSFVQLGFRPAVILIKRYDGAGNWILVDNERNKFNVVDKQLLPNDSMGDYTEAAIDFVSNGFKMRLGTSGHVNIYSYIYAAWAEAPSFNLYGAQSNAR